MQDRSLFPGFLFACAVIGALVCQGTAFVICRSAKLRVLEFRLFYGRPIIKRVIGDTEIALGWIPAGGYVRYEPEAHAKLRLGWRLFLLFGSLIPIAVLGVCVLGWPEFLRHVTTGLFQFIEGAKHPLSVGPSLMAKGHEAARNSLIVAAGLIWAKQTAFMYRVVLMWRYRVASRFASYHGTQPQCVVGTFGCICVDYYAAGSIKNLQSAN